MSTTFTAPTRTRSKAPTKSAPAEPRRRSFTEQRRTARRAAADRSLRAQLVKGRSLVQLVVSSRGKESRWPFAAAFALIAGISVIALLMVNTATAQSSFTEQKLNDELHELTLAEQQLQQQVAAKQAPGALAQNAQELGMQPGSNPGNLVISADGSVTWIEPSPPPAPPVAAGPAPAAEPVPAESGTAEQLPPADQAAADAQAQADTQAAADAQSTADQAQGDPPQADQPPADQAPADQAPTDPATAEQPQPDQAPAAPAQPADQPATGGA